MKNKASLIPFIILFVTVLGCGRFTRQAATEKPDPPTLNHGSSTFSLAGKEWKSFEFDEMDIKVDLPGQPTDKSPLPSQFPPGYKEIFSSIRLHSYDESEFGSSYSQLVPTGKRPFEIKELAETSMAALKKQARDLTYTHDITSPSKARYNGTFTRNGKDFELRGCCIYQKTKPLRVWSVITIYPKDNDDARTASQRIIESVVFKGSSEVCK